MELQNEHIKEALSNIRVAVKAGLIIIPHTEYRKWAYDYLGARNDRDARVWLYEFAEDQRLKTFSNPWETAGRLGQCWVVVSHICLSLDYIEKDDYMNASNEAQFALDKLGEIVNIDKQWIEEFSGWVRKSRNGV